jgi:tyrosine-protein kinase Etk/Wzc
MSENSNSVPIIQNRLPVKDEMIDPQKIVTLLRTHKYFFIVTLLAGMIIAFLYNTYTMPVFRVSAKLLIEDDKEANSSGNDQLLEGFGLMPGMKNLDNQITVLTSRSLLLTTLDELMFNTEYYVRGLIKKRSLYPLQPIKIIPVSGSQLPEDVEFTFKYLGDNMFFISGKSDNSFEIQTTASFGENIDFNDGTFRIERNEIGWPSKDEERKICFIFHSRRELVESYIKRLKIDPVTKKGTIVKISLEGTNKLQDLTFLDKLTKEFVNISLDKKNSEAIRTIQFIDSQLSGLSDSLLITESRLQQFRTRNMVMNLSSQGQAIIDQAMKLENEKSSLTMEANYYDYLAEYLDKDIVGEVPIAPATMGIVDPGLARLVTELADQQGQLYSKGMGAKNPMQNQLAQRVQSIKEALKETLKGMKGANELALKENEAQINAVNSKASALPRTERELLGIERKYKLNDELYTFLLEKRAIAQMQKASNTADNEIIDYPEYENEPVRPNKAIIYLFAFFTGIGFPFLWIFFADIFNIRIRKLEEVTQLSDLPITGYIPRSPMKKNTMVLDEPDSPVAEAFRLLRSRMTFFTKDTVSPVILITSSIPAEGKTYIAVNLASAYSLMGKKTILIGFDLRQPGIYSDFNLDNERGLSTWLIGKHKLQDIIKMTNYNNLHIISSGPVPPNPAELTLLEKTDELFRILKQRYDCIIVDSSPAGIVSDTYHLVSLADTCILIVKQNYTIKEIFINTLSNLKTSNIKSLSLLINGVFSNNSRYGYGGKYTYNNNKPKKAFWNIVSRSLHPSK